MIPTAETGLLISSLMLSVQYEDRFEPVRTRPYPSPRQPLDHQFRSRNPLIPQDQASHLHHAAYIGRPFASK